MCFMTEYAIAFKSIIMKLPLQPVLIKMDLRNYSDRNKTSKNNAIFGVCMTNLLILVIE